VLKALAEKVSTNIDNISKPCWKLRWMSIWVTPSTIIKTRIRVTAGTVIAKKRDVYNG